jgi:hypothetical protein
MAKIDMGELTGFRCCEKTEWTDSDLKEILGRE